MRMLGDYVVLRKLAEGGMAELYLGRATHLHGLGRLVTLKVVRGNLAREPAFARMFAVEARVLCRLCHPNIVQALDFDVDESTGCRYLAMEHVRGHSLEVVAAALRRRGQLVPPVMVAHVGAMVATGLHCVHELTLDGSPVGLVHRDVSPSNVLVSFAGEVKLIDFGIAKGRGFEASTRPGTVKGKFRYLSPEQACGAAVDRRSDVFSLGIVLWQLLTGRLLFSAASDVAVLREIVESGPIPRADEVNPTVPLRLASIVARALERTPPRRYPTAQSLALDLRRFVWAHQCRLEEADVGVWLRTLFIEVPSAEFDARACGAREDAPSVPLLPSGEFALAE
jgi:serine/threonine protein kinase